MISKTVSAAGARSCHVLNPNPPVSWRRHITDHLMTILEDSGPESGAPQAAGYGFAGPGHGLGTGLIIHPGSGGAKKNWPLERFLAVAESRDGDVTFILGPAEIERGLGDAMPGGMKIVCTPTLDVLCRQFSAGDVYLGNDSGVSHCASFCGMRSIVLFGPTDPVVWRPLGDRVTVLSSDDGTMEGIGTERVVDVL